MKLHLRIHRILLFVLWIVVLVLLYGHFRVRFLIVALILALAGGVSDIWILYRMAVNTEVMLEPGAELSENPNDFPVYLHITNDSRIPSAELLIVISWENESDGSRQEKEITYPLYSYEDFREKLPAAFTDSGTYRLTLEKMQLRDFLGFSDLIIPLDSELQIHV